MKDQNGKPFFVTFTQADQEVPTRPYDLEHVVTALHLALQAARSNHGGRVNFLELNAARLHVFTNKTSSISVTALTELDLAKVYLALRPLLAVVPKNRLTGKMTKDEVLAKMEELSQLAI